MQHRPRSDSATGHSDGINHAAPTQHRWGRELPLLGAEQGCSPVPSTFIPSMCGVSWASRRSPWGSR